MKANDSVEEQLLSMILDGKAGDSLPAERDLAASLGVNRQPLREALQRLSRDGWIEIRHGKATTIKDYTAEGGLSILDALARRQRISVEWIGSLLDVRLALAPAYTSAAVRHHPEEVAAYLQKASLLEDEAGVFTDYDWHLHRLLCQKSENAIYPMLLNSFAVLYHQVGELYFSLPTARQSSLQFYHDVAAVLPDAERAAEAVQVVMKRSIEIWHTAAPGVVGA